MKAQRKQGASCPRLSTQLWRGAIGAALIAAAAFLYSTNFWLSVALVALSVIPLRGCPVCWIVETCEAGRNETALQDKKETKNQ